MGDRSRVVSTKAFYQALVAAGVLREDETIRRVVIDANAGDVVVMYVERWGDERLLQVATTLDGIEVSSVPADADA
ncbi:MAG TPA: hypothetical protein VHM23_19660 [Actinomycetota bacterium]|jgi:hypothetical protein|nr:hypothetical protein [Actinomycetota bacterium]